MEGQDESCSHTEHIANAVESKATFITKQEWEEIDEKAIMTIQLCLTNQVLCEVSHYTTTLDLWLKLEQLYMTKSLVNKIHLKEHLYTIHMVEGCSLGWSWKNEF